MKVGDVVEHEGRLHRVLRHNRLVHVMVAAPWEGDPVEIADNDPIVKVVHNPAAEWPMTTVPLRHKAGPMRAVLHRGRELEPLLEWMPSDPFRPGGAVFLSPQLNLKRGEVLTVRHQDGSTSRLVVGKGFGTIAQKQRRQRAKQAAPKRQPNAFDRIWEGDDED